MYKLLALFALPLFLNPAFLATAAADPLSEDHRAEISCDGTWQRAILPADAMPQPDTKWTDFSAPSLVDPHPRPQAISLWLQRDVEIPADWAGRRIFIDLRGARYAPQVYVDGKLIGARLDGWSPFRVELTGAVTPGQANRIQVVCRDLSAVIKQGIPWQEDGGIGKKKAAVIAPVGGFRNNFGLWDSVRLECTAKERIVDDELVITTSTRNETIALSGKVDAGSVSLAAGSKVEASVVDGQETVLKLGPGAVGADGQWKLSAPFPKAHFWSPEDPHLYHLLVQLLRADGTVEDGLTRRFGFREIWTQGPDFYLNGVKRHMLATSYWPPFEPKQADFIQSELKRIKAAGANTFRFHIGGWQEAWIDAADEIGLMIVVESPAYTDGDGFYDYKNPAFWQNYKDCVAGVIRRDRNHASVLMWSLGNELLFMGNKKYDADLPKKQGDLARFARTIDPTRPLTFEADQDPDGAFDVIGLHYPHELPQNFAYPNTADWLNAEMETEAGGGMLGQAKSQFKWNREKPLYIGEYLWVPLNDYSSGSIFYGDDAYLNREEYQDKAKRAAWVEQTLGYRRAGVSGMCPWGAAADDKDYYRPVAAFLRNHDMRCFGGETFELDFDVYNDSDQPHEMSLALSGLDVPAHSLSLEAGGHELVKLEVPTKISEQSVAIQFDSVLSADGAEMHRVTHVLHVEPRREFQAPKGIELISYDPSGKWPHSTSSLNALAWADVAKTLLLLAPGSLGKAESNDAASKPQSGTFDASALKQFLARGGKCLVLEQNTLEPLGLDLELVKHASTMTFPVTIAHPLLKGIDASELSFWRGDNFVTHDEIVRPKFGGARGITVSGGPETLNQSPIVELSVGQGRMVLMQALVGEKRSTEPAAATLLQNAADYLSSLPPTAASTLVLTHDKDFLDKLKSLRLDFTAPKGPLTTTQLHGATLLIIHGGGPMIADSADAIVQFHHDGGTIYWHQPSAEALATIGRRIGAEGLAVKPQPAAATISRRDEPMLLGVTREDLTFHTAPSGWTRSLALQTTASEEFLPHDEPDHSSDLPIAQFSDLKGASLSNGALVFGSRGDAALDVDVSQPGTFQLALSISSTGAPKERPLLGVFINDAFGGLIRLEQDDKSAYLVTLHAPASHFKLKLSWLNGAEYGDGSEVRVHSVEIGSPMHLPENVTPLVDSCALVSIGARSPVILDGIEWDKTGSNEIRGSRYASAMLFNLGATFKSGAD